MLKIKEVTEQFLGEELGFESGDSIIAFNGYEVYDLLDYLYYDAQSEFTVTVLAKDGQTVELQVEKDEDDSLGLIFENDGLQVRTCHNDCIFCFVKQMPQGMRSTLYVKDDDYRQSFLCGNFVTLTNVNEEHLQRIIRLKLSPLYISIHTMNGELRKKMMNNRFADKIEYQLEQLCKAGIEVHAQIVLVPSVNDGKELDYTLNRLKTFNNVKTVAVVPCGITKFREGLYPINDIDKEYAASVIKQVESANNQSIGPLISLADEFYFKAEQQLPPYESYGEFWQVENGVGLSAKFMRDVEQIIECATAPLLAPGKYLTVTGTSAYNFVMQVVKKVQNSCKNVTIEVVAVQNEFFGHTVNCTGLLTGQDIYGALKDIANDYDCLLIPNPCLMQFEDLFLDGMSINELSQKLGIKVKRAAIS
ncbi:MAG: DUF512 domain-containing protein [Clostridia bacterium]|nr:DUF512 domain-containing protein [Clostridia bacterium]